MATLVRARATFQEVGPTIRSSGPLRIVAVSSYNSRQRPLSSSVRQLTHDHDPLTRVIDAPLAVDQVLLVGLAAFRTAPKLLGLPGVDPAAERERLSKVLDDLADVLFQGISANPRKLWVMRQFQRALEAVRYEDTEGREHFGMELEQLMDLLQIDSSDGLLNFDSVGI